MIDPVIAKSLEILLTAGLAALVGYGLLRKQIKGEMRENLNAYERGRVDEAGRREHEFELLRKEVDSLKAMDSRRSQLDAASPIIDYFTEHEETLEYHSKYPLASILKFISLVEKDERVEFDSVLKSYNKAVDSGGYMIGDDQHQDSIEKDITAWKADVHEKALKVTTWLIKFQMRS